ncbi:RING-type E3 ubiquitin transferase [Trifolium repens]|nr:RING-type E3 ubiquitin transferase [Trifolium repens]
MMNQVVRGLNVRGSTTMMQRSTFVDDVLILDSFVGNSNMISSSLSTTTTSRRVGGVNPPSFMVNNHDHVPVSNVMPPWLMLDQAIVFDSNSIAANLGHRRNHNPNVTRDSRVNNRVNHQNFQQLFMNIDDESTTIGSCSSKSDLMCCICLTELSTGSSAAVRMPQHCCSHVFHSDCIQEWLNVNMTCPLCRRDV